MLGNNKKGFTLIEILIVIAIIGVMMSVIVPNVKRLLPRKEREAFLSKLNGLTRYAWQHALIERKVHQVEFDFNKKIVWVGMVTGTMKEGNPEVVRIKNAYTATSIPIPANIEIQNFIIEGYDELSRSDKRSAAYFFIMPDGLTQTVTINFIDKKHKNSAGKPRQFGLVLNPFNAQFKVYDSFQK